MPHAVSSAEKTLDRIHLLAAISDDPAAIQRTFLSPAMRRVNALVGGWMRAVGCEVTEDGWGNLIGHLPGETENAPTLLLGSHLDTVPNAGRFDGPLGVVVALASLESLRNQGIHLPFHVDILGFSDEEGTRFHSAYLGSKALTGAIVEADLQLVDAHSINVQAAVANHQGKGTIGLPLARYSSDQLLGYIEVHIEQGPLLEQSGHALGVVEAIAAQTRLVYTITGRSGHAGTTPMNLRHDALAAAAEIVLLVEQIGRETPGLVATVGQLVVQPGASNVIPDQVRFTVDIRHPDRSIADKACDRLALEAEEAARRRALGIEHSLVQSTEGVICAAALVERLFHAVKKQQSSVPRLVSGAGHDGIILSRLTPIAMLFIRCKEGLSHHPDEDVSLTDIDAAISALTSMLRDWK